MRVVVVLCWLWWSGCAPEATFTLPFRALVGGRSFGCDTIYEGLGASKSAARFEDLRLYVSRLRLVRPDGSEQPLALVPDGAFQGGSTALLDFEDRRGSCAGTRATHETIHGRAPAGQYTGLRFDVGVPFEQNHGDPARALAPLDVSSMFWVWRHGYKFMRVELRSERERRPLVVHLGSTGCSGDGAVVGPPARCTRPNRAPVDLRFVPDRDAIALELSPLLASFTLEGESASDGCEASPDDPDCAPVFTALGLSRAPQQVFAAVPR
jgi:uncharacterized repeat protein (TIGR04052 family)